MTTVTDITDTAPNTGATVFSTANSRACEEYMVERMCAGPVFKTQYILVLRHHSGRDSRVLLTTSDIERAAQVERALQHALQTLTVTEFIAQLNRTPKQTLRPLRA